MSYLPCATRLRAAMLCSGALLCLPLSAHAWVSVNNKGLQLKDGLVIGDAPASEPVHIAVSLNLRDKSGLQSFINNSRSAGNPQYGQVLTSAQFNAQYAPTAAQAQAVSDYLASAGFTNIVVAGNNAVITANGTAGVTQKAFNTHLVDFGYNGKRLYGNTTDVQVPDALNGIVLSVAGVTNLQTMHLHTRIAPVSYQDPIPTRSNALASTASARPQAGAAVAHSGYSGADFAIAYDAGKTSPAYATTVAIVTEGDDLSTVTSQLRLAERVYNQPVVPYKIVQIGTLPNPQDTSGDDEWDLDSQSSTGIAQNVNLLVFYNTVTLGDSDLVPAVNQFAVDNLAQIGNQSYGGCEAEEVAPVGDVGAFEQAFMQAVAQGQTWFASTGDTGSACGSPVNTGYPTGVPNAEYPASSPNVVAAGGTTLSTDADYNYVSETSWIGGGGGTSYIFAPPQWQVASGAVPTSSVPSLPTGTATGVPASEAGAGRGTPDVAMSADPASGLSTFVGGAAETVGGTSLASPLSMGAYARVQTTHCNKLNFASPQFYALDTTKGLLSTAKGFTDVTSGSNGAYVATTGWDYNTGFGSFDITALNAALPATACVLNHPPVAQLNADTGGGLPGLKVTFNGIGSSDVDGDSIVQYVIDFGDNSDVVIQASPTFPPHTYATVGTYVASLSVRDSAGNASLPTTLPITIYGTPVSCTLPGQQLVTSPPGVALAEMGIDLASGEDDLLATYFAEPASLPGALVVTMKVNNLTMVMPGFRWVTYFNIPEDANNHYVAMVSADGATPTYNYGLHTFTSTPAASLTSFMYQGDLEATSTNTADGTITLVLDKSKLGLKTGDVLSAIMASVRTSAPDDTTGTTSAGQGLTQDTGTATQNYTLVGNDVCAKDIATPPTVPPGAGAPISSSGGTIITSPAGGTTTTPSRLGGSFGLVLAPLMLLAGVRRRRGNRRR